MADLQGVILEIEGHPKAIDRVPTDIAIGPEHGTGHHRHLQVLAPDRP
ncbi:MAG: hypothetical protein ACLQFF_05960 [Steroidobacteraceae bacterium]